jgi:hypothetical protein
MVELFWSGCPQLTFDSINVLGLKRLNALFLSFVFVFLCFLRLSVVSKSGMKVGGSREIIIPAAEGYGANGFPAWGIPPGGTLNFTIEALKVA